MTGGRNGESEEESWQEENEEKEQACPAQVRAAPRRATQGEENARRQEESGQGGEAQARLRGQGRNGRRGAVGAAADRGAGSVAVSDGQQAIGRP
ncbi:MAG: hypothetical protein FJY54_07005 [Betaproteobacteria bacterium]|nr:hypothetical protein [Betaproteobacteria bacterium]